MELGHIYDEWLPMGQNGVNVKFCFDCRRFRARKEELLNKRGVPFARDAG
jgi:hypothetical protein